MRYAFLALAGALSLAACHHNQNTKARYDDHDLTYGVGGSGMFTKAEVTGQVKSTWFDNLTLVDQAGNKVKFDTTKDTVVWSGDKQMKLDQLPKGCEVRASYHLKGNDKIADRIDVVQLPGSATPQGGETK